MKILIKSRSEIEGMQFTPKTAVISITDYGYYFADLKNKPDYLLQLAFDDVDNDVFIDELGRKPTEDERKAIENKYHMFTDEQAERLATFYLQISSRVDTIICQCEHGQSRSAAIAAAILEYKCRKGILIFADDRYYPNKTVFNKTLKAIKG
jgi:predicted protein tyrosine phosphatase